MYERALSEDNNAMHKQKALWMMFDTREACQINEAILHDRMITLQSIVHSPIP